MFDYGYFYREVIPDQTVTPPSKIVNFNTGGTQSTLQDIKVAERANGYCYLDNSRHITRNRFIYWRLNNDTLELAEESLDINLSGNRLSYKFFDSPILSGISIHETHSQVIFLIPTVCSVHRLTFTHPNAFYGADCDSLPGASLPSIFASTNMQNGTSYVFVPPPSANSQLPHVSASWLTHEEEAIFTFAYPSGEFLLVKHPMNAPGESFELKCESIVPKFLTGILRPKNSNNYIVSILLHTIGLETYAITLCREGHLKVWSCSRNLCIAVSDILISDENTSQKLRPLEDSQCQLLKKVVGSDENDFVFAAYTSSTMRNVFHILKPIISGNQFNIVNVHSIEAVDGDLIDYSFTSTSIWSILRSKDGDWQVYNGQFCPNELGLQVFTSWNPVTLEPLPNPQEVFYDDSIFDPKQVYLDFIFYPGRFPLRIISKALCIYTRSMVVQDVQISANTLKQRVAMAVETQILEKLQEQEVSDSEYIDKAACCWSDFYSCCVQYHVTDLRPLGILLLPSVSGAVLLKKAAYSFLRPVDILEELILSPANCLRNSFYAKLDLTDKQRHDFLLMSEIFDFIDENLADELDDEFERNLSVGVSPMDAIRDILKIAMVEFLENFLSLLKRCKDLYPVMHKLLEFLRMDEENSGNELPAHLKGSVSHLFTSSLGTSVVAQSFAQQVQAKFAVCRNLLIVQWAVLENQNHVSSILLHTVIKLEVDIILNAYFSLLWLCKQVASPVLPLDSQNQRLASLKFSPVFNAEVRSLTMTNLVEMYALSNGGFEAHKALISIEADEDSLPHWHKAFLSYLSKFTLLIWPISGNPEFLEWLLCAGQHLHLQRYVNLLGPWCNFNTSSRSFLMAVSFLNTGEISKAYQLFSDVLKDPSIADYVIERVQPIADASQIHIMLNLKVIHLLELHGARDCAIKVAEVALIHVSDEDAFKPTLHSIIFKHHLALGHYEEAFKALCANPAAERKEDNLRDLVKTLLDGGHISILMTFNYEDLEDLFLRILYTRARATDSIDNIYYDFLYAFAVQKNMWRLSASVMYEEAYRLSLHTSAKGLEKQVMCYMLSLNSLELEQPKFAWVLKPTDAELEEEEVLLPPMAGSHEEPEIIKLKRQVDVIDIEGIRKEMVFAKAKLHLALTDANSVTHHLRSPQELLMFLSASGLYKTAFKICEEFDLGAEVIFENLVYQCMSLDESEDCQAWNWLMENDIYDFEYIPNAPSKMAWLMLNTYLKDQEELHMSRYHRVITEKMIQLGQLPPVWLLHSYKQRNPAELLRLYHSVGLLKEATQLGIEYVNAALGFGPEYFGISKGLSSVSKPMSLCLPVYAIDALLYELKLQDEHNPEKVFEKDYEMLKDLFLNYVDNANRLSQLICKEQTVSQMS